MRESNIYLPASRSRFVFNGRERGAARGYIPCGCFCAFRTETNEDERRSLAVGVGEGGATATSASLAILAPGARSDEEV